MLEFDIRRVRSFLHWGCVRRVIGSEERIDGNLFVEFKGLFMKCPICVSVDLLMSERKGIEIDYCPSCRGVWLDRGELDKFIQQAEQQSQAQSFGSVQAPGRFQQDVAPRYEKQDDDHRIPDPRKYGERKYDDRDSYDDRHYDRRGKKKESFWSEIFDFD